MRQHLENPKKQSCRRCGGPIIDFFRNDSIGDYCGLGCAINHKTEKETQSMKHVTIETVEKDGRLTMGVLIDWRNNNPLSPIHFKEQSCNGIRMLIPAAGKYVIVTGSRAGDIMRNLPSDTIIFPCTETGEPIKTEGEWKEIGEFNNDDIVEFADGNIIKITKHENYTVCGNPFDKDNRHTSSGYYGKARAVSLEVTKRVL